MRANLIAVDACRKARLTPRQQFIIAKAEEGWKHWEIAEFLGISRPVVSKTVKICIIKLRGIRELLERDENIQRAVYGMRCHAQE